MPVNWRDMETEELGSVYESLLELTPRLTDDGRGFAFAEGGEAKGHARKTTGSYYTPDSLVQALLDCALDPVLDRVEAEADDPAAALLSVTVLDPACGSGHFLLAAARRIATRSRAPAPAASPRRRTTAMRCAMWRAPASTASTATRWRSSSTKVALWIETVEPGKPLGFLDANIRCGDSLLGVFDLKALEQGHSRRRLQAARGRRQGDREAFRRRATRPSAQARAASISALARAGCRPPRRWPATRRRCAPCRRTAREEIAAQAQALRGCARRPAPLEPTHRLRSLRRGLPGAEDRRRAGERATR